MTSLYNRIKNLVNAREDRVIFTWDTFHLLITVLIFIALMILIWINRLDRCVKNNNNNDRNNEELCTEESTPSCIDTDNSVFV